MSEPMEHEQGYIYLCGVAKALQAFIDKRYGKAADAPPVLYEGNPIDGFTVLTHVVGDEDLHSVLVSGAHVGSSDLLRGIKSLTHSLIGSYEMPRNIVALALLEIAQNVVDGKNP